MIVVAIVAVIIFIKTPPSSDNAHASFNATLNANQIITDSTHEFDTDIQQTYWSAKQVALATGTSGQYIAGDLSVQNFPAVVSSTYQSLVTQSGTSAPTGSTLHNDFGSTTFTWARTGTGTYTLTANSPVFTSGKTAVLMSNPNAFLNNFKYTVTSSTVITFQTATLSVISLLLTPGNADNLLSNTMIYVIVYP